MKTMNMKSIWEESNHWYKYDTDGDATQLSFHGQSCIMSMINLWKRDIGLGQKHCKGMRLLIYKHRRSSSSHNSLLRGIHPVPPLPLAHFNRCRQCKPSRQYTPCQHCQQCKQCQQCDLNTLVNSLFFS